MSILMDALKQQVEPSAGISGAHTGNGWRNLALLLGFCLALLLGYALASGLQNKTDISAMMALNKPASQQTDAPLEPDSEPELASNSSIVKALTDTASADNAELAAPEQLSEQEQLKPEKKMASVTAPAMPKSSVPVVMPVVTSEPLAQQADVVAQPEVEVSEELRQRFASAIAASDANPRSLKPAIRANGAPAIDISELAPATQLQIPALRFEAHVYATQSQQRWVKVNGKSLQEGQWVTADIRLKEITPQFVLLEMGTELFSMRALTDYN